MPLKPSKPAQIGAEKRRITTDREKRIQDALQGLNDNTFKNLSQAARHINVGRDTVQSWKDRTHGPASKGQEKNRHLTETQEEALCEWVLCAAEMGKPMSKEALRAKAAELSTTLLDKTAQMGMKHLPSTKWVYRFLERNPQLVL